MWDVKDKKNGHRQCTCMYTRENLRRLIIDRRLNLQGTECSSDLVGCLVQFKCSKLRDLPSVSDKTKV